MLLPDCGLTCGDFTVSGKIIQVRENEVIFLVATMKRYFRNGTFPVTHFTEAKGFMLREEGVPLPRKNSFTPRLMESFLLLKQLMNLSFINDESTVK